MTDDGFDPETDEDWWAYLTPDNLEVMRRFRDLVWVWGVEDDD